MRGVVYQIYPRSFQDSDGDGIGDLRGIIRRLDYLADLGVDALWLSPIQPSPDRDFGYDISDYCAVDPIFGDLQIFDELAAGVRSRGMQLVLDLVVNHSSDQHPWFRQRPEWYIWAEQPNNWASVFGGSGWTWDERRQQHYFHSFLPSQPDLNWHEPALRQAIADVMRFWLERGVDGFRLDVFNCYYKDAQLRDNPRRLHPAGLVYEYLGQRHVYDRDRPELAQALSMMRQLMDEEPGRFLVGETLDEDPDYARAASYVGPDKLHMAFNFRLLRSRWSAPVFRQAILAWSGQADWPTWVLSNHDFPRHFTRHCGTWGGGRHGLARARLCAILLFCLRGSPFLYYGEELGMAEGRIPFSRLQDPPGRRFWPFYRGRDGCRTPMQWDEGPQAGFSTVEPWLPVNPDWREKNVAAQQEDPGSVLSTYRDLIRLRKRHPALHSGPMQLGEEHPQLLSWTRDETVSVVLNMSGRALRWAAPRGELLYDTHGGVAPPARLEPYQGLVLQKTTACGGGIPGSGTGNRPDN